MVQYINSLRTQERASNPSYVEENRQAFLEPLRELHSWFPSDEALYVPTLLDQMIAAFTGEYLPVDVVFLTGDAGDGKTALCAKLARRLGYSRQLGIVERVGRWTLVKDASEVDEDDLRQLIISHLEQRGRESPLLVALNEGRLRRLMQTAVPVLGPLWQSIIEPALESWIDEEAAVQLDARMRAERVAVVNFRHRMHVRLVVPRLLTAWTPPSLWEDTPTCGPCEARTRCPILANAKALREETTQERIADVLTSGHYAGQRLPFRRLQAVLAMTCTGGLHCRDVRDEGALSTPQVRPHERLRYRFYESLFYREVKHPVSVSSEPITQTLAPADAGMNTSYQLDQEIAVLAAQPPGSAFPATLGDCPLPSLETAAIEEVQQSMLPGGASRSNPGAELARVTRSLRRWVALSGSLGQDPWRRALYLLEDYAQRNQEEPLRRMVVGALNRLHRHQGTREDSITPYQIDPAGFRNPARLALELDLGVEFKTRLRKGPELPALVKGWLEACPSEIYLEAWPAGTPPVSCARLRLDARLVEALFGVREGYTFLMALGPFRRDLARFHSHLLALATEHGHAPSVTLRVNGKGYQLIAAALGEDIPPRLRFEGKQ